MSTGHLLVKDTRTGNDYAIPIERNAVLATDLKKIKGDALGSDPADKVTDGLRVYDPGLQNTAVIKTASTFADSDRGLLLYRGHRIEQLWQADFEDMLHLMVWGELPSALQRESLRQAIAERMVDVPATVVNAVNSFPRSSPPMPMVLAGLATFIGSDPESIPAFNGGNIYHGNSGKADDAIISTVAAYAVVLGLAVSRRRGVKPIPASRNLTFYENLFVMTGNIDPATGLPDPVKLSCFRRFAVLNADHGMALCAFVFLVTASSLPDPMSCLISALAAAYGPLHFGAPESAYRVLKRVGKPENVPAFLEEVKRGKSRLFGFGHRTYKVVDPRLAPIKIILEDLDLTANPLLPIAKEIERRASSDAYFTSRNLNANSDFYGIFVFLGTGFDAELVPIMMLAQRLVGMMAHWRESLLRDIKLFRPSHIYTGPTDVSFTRSML